VRLLTCRSSASKHQLMRGNRISTGLVINILSLSLSVFRMVAVIDVG